MGQESFTIKEGPNKGKNRKIGWQTIVFLLIIALLGLYGFMPLSKTKKGSLKNGFQVEFYSLLRFNQDAPLIVRVSPEPANNNFDIWIKKDFLRGMNTLLINPKPSNTYIGKDHYIFSFKRTNNSEPETATFYLKPLKIGNQKLQIGPGNGDLEEIDFFVYP